MECSKDRASRASGPNFDAPVDRNGLVVEFLWLADRCAAGYTGRGEHYDDLRQVAVIGLIKAAGRYDPDRGVPFAAYAVPTMKGELRHHFRDLGWSVKVPGHVKELRAELRTAVSRLEQRLGRSPRPDEVADHLCVAHAALDAAIRADQVYDVESLDAMGAYRGSDSSDDSLADIGSDVVVSATARIEALDALASLDERARAIVYWRYFEDRTQQEIAERLGIGQAHVSRLLASALRSLARGLGAAARTSTRAEDESMLQST
jgi:RNA polymerase sigma-B factor